MKYLLDQSETSDHLKIKVLNGNKRELLRDLQRRPEFDQSALFKKVYEQEFGIFGGSPFAALIGDYEFGRGSGRYRTAGADLAGRRRGACAVPVRGRVRSCSTWTASRNSDAPRDLAKIFDTTEYAKWKCFRQSEDSRYVGLTCAARADARCPTARTKQIDAFHYEESVDGTDHSKYLWGNAAYALGARHDQRLRAVRLVRGDSRRGRRRPGGRPAGAQLPHRRRRRGDEVPHRSSPSPTGAKRSWPTWASLPLVHCKGTDYAAFFSVQSRQKPKLYDKEAANANARLSTQLPYILAVSRFAHYLKAMMRDKIGQLHVARRTARCF